MMSLEKQWKEQASSLGLGPVDGLFCVQCGESIEEHRDRFVQLIHSESSIHSTCLTALIKEHEYDQPALLLALGEMAEQKDRERSVSDIRRLLCLVRSMCQQARHPLALSLERFAAEFNTEYSILLSHASTDVALMYKKAVDEISLYNGNLVDVIVGQMQLLQNRIGREHCCVQLKKLTLPPVYETVFKIIVARHCAADTILTSMLSILKHVTAADLSIREELVAFADSEYVWWSTKALQQLQLHDNPYAKVDCLILTKHLLHEAVHAWCESTDRADIVINGDDMVSLFEFMIIKSGMLQPHAQVSFMEEFLDPCYGSGEAAYLMTTLQVAINAIENITTI